MRMRDGETIVFFNEGTVEEVCKPNQLLFYYPCQVNLCQFGRDLDARYRNLNDVKGIQMVTDFPFELHERPSVPEVVYEMPRSRELLFGRDDDSEV